MCRRVTIFLLFTFLFFTSFLAFSKPAASKITSQKIAVKLAAVINQGGPYLQYGIKWWIVAAKPDAEGNYKVLKTSTESEPVFHLFPGNYRVMVAYANMKIDRSITLTGQSRQKKIIALGPGRLRVIAKLTKDGTILNRKVQWTVHRVQANNKAANNLIQEKSTNPVFRLSPGKYTIRARIGEVFLNKEVEIDAGKFFESTFVFHAGSIKLNAKFEGSEREISGQLRWKLYRLDKEAPVLQSDGSKLNLVLPSGEYRVEVQYGNAVAKVPITLAAGETVQKSLILDAGELFVRGIEIARAPFIDHPIRWSLKPVEQKDSAKMIDRYASGAHFILRAGSYLLKAVYGNAEITTAVKIASGEALKKTVNFNVGRIRMSAISEESPIVLDQVLWRVYSPGHRIVARFKGSQPLFILPAGKYQIDAQYKKLNAESQIVIQPGRRISQTMVLEK